MTTSRPDSEVSIQVAPDRLWASVRIPAECDPGVLSADNLAILARAAGVVVEERERQNLTRIIERFTQTREALNIKFAQATPPQPASGAEIDWKDGFNPDRPATERACGAVDHYSSNSLATVEQGTVIAQIIDAKPGVEGRDVMGNAIPAPKAADAPYDFEDKFFEINDKREIVAKTGGVLRIRSGLCTIDDVLRIKGNVDFETGHIETTGSVVIGGDVRDRFEVRAKGDIEIVGLVEAATIECGGDLMLRKGMAARDVGSLLVHGNASVGFIDSAKATFEGDLEIRKEVIATEMIIGGRLIGERAAIIGGTTTASGEVIIGALGTRAEAPTVLKVGSLPFLEKELVDAQREKNECEREIDKLDEEEKDLKQKSLSLTPQQKERFTEIEFFRADFRQRHTRAIQRVEEIKRELEARTSVSLSVRTIIHPGVSICTEDQTITFRNPVKGPVSFGWSEHRRLMMKKTDGKWYDAEDIVARAA
ncbi:MAG: hypothetical protein Tsb0013_03140 [Phycisphaerales bacterium]